MIKKILAMIIMVGLISSIGIGCRPTKSSYEKKMKNIIKDSADSLKKIDFTNPPESESENKKRINKTIDAVEEFQKKIEKVKPPEDYFEGHSDLVEFADLFVSYLKEQLKSDKEEEKKDEEKSQEAVPTIENEQFEKFQASRRAYERAKQELPILEYELQEAFNDVLQSQQFSPFGSSPFGGGFMPPQVGADTNDKKE